jgi:hypothetical protein
LDKEKIVMDNFLKSIDSNALLREH